MQLLLLAGVFFGTLLAILAVYNVVNRRELQAADTARAMLRRGINPGAPDHGGILRDQRTSDIPFLDRLLAGRELTARIATELERAGSERRVGEFVLASVAGSIVGLVIGARIGPVYAILFALGGGLAPTYLLTRAKGKRTRQFELQLPEGLDMLVNALKAGYSLQAAMEFVGAEMPGPLGPEFARFYDEQRLGIDVRTALLRLQERIGTADARMFVTSLLVQRETGGNLGEVLSNLATLMRERVAFRGEVETLTAEAKFSARILASLPGVVYVGLRLFQPDFVRPLQTQPEGAYILAYAAASCFVGYMVMRKIADIEM
jgi:tight adherence protein B